MKYSREFLRGAHACCQAALLETEAWQKMAAAAADSRERAVCAGIAEAFKDFSSRLIGVTNAALSELTDSN